MSGETKKIASVSASGMTCSAAKKNVVAVPISTPRSACRPKGAGISARTPTNHNASGSVNSDCARKRIMPIWIGP